MHLTMTVIDSPLMRLRARPAFGAFLGFTLGLLPCQSPTLLPESLNVMRFAGAVLAGGAAYFTMHPRRRWREIVPFGRILLAFALAVLVFSSLYAFSVVHVDTGMGTRAVSVGLWRDSDSKCCRDVRSRTCLEKRIGLDDGRIKDCWGDFPVISARLLLVLSYGITTLLGGTSVGLYLLRQVGVPGWRPIPTASEGSAKEILTQEAPDSAYDLFLSYSSEDRKFVEELVADLNSKGLAIWWDRPQIGAGDSISGGISEGLSRSRRFAVVLSPAAVRSPWVNKEIGAALSIETERSKADAKAQAPFLIIPILREACDVPALLKDKRCADFTRSYEEGLDELLQQLLSRSSPRQSQPS
jgi:TIR domain-containing protein